MAINPDFNYQDKLALDKAKLVARSRINALGAYELTIQYNNIPSAMREDCIEWLEANRLEVTDPTVSFKTYEGTWNCLSIGYNEDSSILRQIFKVDVGVGDLGDWDGTPPEPTWGSQAGDLSRISDGTELERSYYWRVTSPENYEIPPTAQTGEIWTKTANDNGDGTYDVTISKEVAVNQVATSAVNSGGTDGGYVETSEVNTNDSEQSFVADGGSVADAVAGETKRIENTPLENGKFRTTVTTRTAKSIEATSRSEAAGFTESSVVNTSDTEQDFVSNGGTIPDATNGVTKRIENVPLDDGKFRTTVTTRTDVNLTATSAVEAGDAYTEDIDISTNNTELVFGVDVANATVGEIKRIDNVPLDNGKFRTTVTTRTAIAQRIPSTEGNYIAWVSDYSGAFDGGRLIVGRNRTYANFSTDLAILNNAYVNSVSISINDYGLFDYTLRSMS